MMSGAGNKPNFNFYFPYRLVQVHGPVLALSLDALIRLLAGEQHVSEVIPVPKLGNGLGPLTGAPDSLTDDILKEVGLAGLS